MNRRIGWVRLALWVVVFLYGGTLSAEGLVQPLGMSALICDDVDASTKESMEALTAWAAFAAQRDVDPQVNGSIQDFLADALVGQ